MSALKYIQIKDILAKYLQKEIHLHPFITEDINNGNILAAYFKLTQMNQMVANLTRKWFFPEFRHLISLYETQSHARQKKWVEAFQKSDLMEWWKTNEEEVENQLLIRLSNHVDSLQGATGINIIKCQKSDKPMIKGTFLHEIYHKSICYSCIDAFKWENDNKVPLSVIKGGRLLSPVLPYVACTPDSFVIKNIDKFWKNLKDPKTVDDSNNILMTLELKTKFTDHVTQREHEKALQDPKYALQVFTEKLHRMKLIFTENTLKDYDSLEMKIDSKKRKSRSQSLNRGFLTKKYPFMRQDHFKAICKSTITSQKRKVTCNVLPNLVLSEKTSNLSRCNISTDECNISDLVSNGMGCLMIFNHQTNEIVEYRMKKAPFILTLNSDYFNQTLEQHLVSHAYSHKSKAIFALGICLGDSSNNVKEPEMSMVYWYDTGITAESIIRVSRVIDKEMYMVSQHIASMKGIFDENIAYLTKEQERNKYLPKLLHDKITSEDLFGHITDSDDDEEEDDENEYGQSSLDAVKNNKSFTSTDYILTPKKKKSVTIYECQSNPDIDWDSLQHLQIKLPVLCKRKPQSSSFSESSPKIAAPNIIHGPKSKNQSVCEENTEVEETNTKYSIRQNTGDNSIGQNTGDNCIETPNLEYDNSLIFGYSETN